MSINREENFGRYNVLLCFYLKKNLDASRLSEHPTIRGKEYRNV